jgi:hypothetical protein
VQDQVPGGGVDNKIGEMSVVTGDTFFVYDVPSGYSVNYGDLEIDGATGNLYIVSSNYTTIAEATFSGALVQLHDLPIGVTSISGIGLDCDNNEGWVGSTDGEVYHLGNMPCGMATTIEEIENVIQTYKLFAGYPNPFNPETRIRFSIPGMQPVSMAIYDVLGNLVNVLVDGPIPAGTHEVVWNATNQDGGKVPSGTYFCRLQAGSFTGTTKLLLVR